MVQPLGSETMEENMSATWALAMAGTQHDSHMGSQSMEKQPTGSKHSCSKVSSTATGLWQDILDIFLLAQEDFCLVWPLWSHHFLAFALALDMAFLGWPLPFVGLAIALLLLGLALGSWLLGCSLGLGLLELVLEPVLMEHGPTPAQGIPPWVPTQLASGTVGNLAREHPAPNKSFALVHRLQSVLVHCVSLSARLPKSTCSGGKNMVYCSICNLLPFHD